MDFTTSPAGTQRFRYSDAGSGPAVVLLHGFPDGPQSWSETNSALVEAGYRVITPYLRGYHVDTIVPGRGYGRAEIGVDVITLLDKLEIGSAVLVGHDWGAINVWNLALLHPNRVAGVINLSVPFMERGPSEWVGFWEQALGGDFYIVHFNRQPGVADAAFAANSRQFLTNLYRTEQWLDEPLDLGPGMVMINMANSTESRGRLMMSEAELQVFVDAFAVSGYTGGINWYRNFTRNWETTSDVKQLVEAQTLMIYGKHDMVPPSESLTTFVPNVEIHHLDCGHWIQQEKPQETTELMLNWLQRHYAN